jgi:hypothetical protein
MVTKVQQSEKIFYAGDYYQIFKGYVMDIPDSMINLFKQQFVKMDANTIKRDKPLTMEFRPGKSKPKPIVKKRKQIKKEIKE